MRTEISEETSRAKILDGAFRITRAVAYSAIVGALVVIMLNKYWDLPDGYVIRPGAEYPPIVVNR